MGQEILGMEDRAEIQLPKLRMAILQAGEPPRIIEVDDPRERLIRDFNECSRDLGLVAEPV